jgi:hypothetical protein
MTHLDPLLQRLSELPLEAPPDAFSAELRARAHARLRARAVHPFWTVTVAACVVTYFAWAVYLTLL